MGFVRAYLARHRKPPPERRTTALVTGGTGFVGNRLARALVERGDRVRALVRDPAGAADLSALGVEVVQGDLTDEASLRRAVEGVDRLFHAAGLVGDRLDRPQAVEVNVAGTRRLLAAAAEAGVTRAVHVSSLSVLGPKHHFDTDESSPYVYGDVYTDTKIDSERVALEFAAAGSIEVVVIRPGFVYGTGDNHTLVPLVDSLRLGKFAFIGDGGKEMNTVYAGDLVHATLLADETPAAAGQVYNITDGRNPTIREFVGFITEYLGIPAPTRHVSVPVAKTAAVILESAARAAGTKSAPRLNRSRLTFLYYNQRYSIEKARRELGYEPHISYREGLPRALDRVAAVEGSNHRPVESTMTDRSVSETTLQTS